MVQNHSSSVTSLESLAESSERGVFNTSSSTATSKALNHRRDRHSKARAAPFRHPSQGSLGSLAGSFWSGIASYPRKFGSNGPADSLADRTSAGGLRQALDKFAVLFAGRKTDHDPDGVGGIGGRSASTARHIQPR